ncbi:hypothetical protein Dsin_008932 [Dipteronia sinensis]|uniref:Filament-like plant protein 7 n=1 Tax=Dipteronia sinensis TaxID=43782 RepID=A0AAE0AQW3_9ROSI|nr:hypothetical protein Dsin_008932 [Dipteronia sinensis]
MEHKTWLWRKRSSEKAIITTDKLDLSLKGNEEEIQILLADKAELETDVKNLNDKLSSVLAECNAKDDLAKKHAKIEQELINGQKKAEVEAVSLKQELNEALEQRIADEERLSHLDAALKECMEQLRFVRKEQEQRIHDAVTMTSREFEKSEMILKEKLAETNKRLAKLGVENTHLSKALLEKERLIEDLNKQRTQAEANFNALMTRLDSTEKENASLKYEIRVLEKELEIRNEEREFNRRTADASHKQHLESVKKIAKLESECQRLRLLVRKRLPGPAALAKMKNEVEMLGRESPEIGRKKLNSCPSSPFGSVVDTTFDNSPDTPGKKNNFLTDQLCAMEEENKTLKEVLDKKINELQFSRSLYSRAAFKLSEVELQLKELSKGQKIMEPTRNSVMPYEVSLGSLSDIGSDDKVSCAESRASALISELEHFRSGKHDSPSYKTVEALDISLMDDFVEMEKLAIVSVDKPSENFHVSPGGKNAIVGPLKTESSGNSSKVMCKEIVPIHDHQSDIGALNLIGKSPDWLQEILKLILEQTHVTERDHHEILEDIRVALENINNPNTLEPVKARESSDHDDRSMLPPVNSSTVTEKINQQLSSDLSLSICKIVELIEGISLPSPPDYGHSETLSKKDGSVLAYKNSETPSGYMVRIFQWKTSELGGVLQQFVHTCYDVLNQKTDFNKFSQEVSTALDWIMNHCFSLQDVSSMEDAIKKHFNWDESRSASEAEIGVISQFTEADRLHLPRENLSSLPMVSLSNGYNNHLQKEELHSNLKEENNKQRDKNINSKGDFLVNQLQESQKIISNLRNELENLRKSKEMFEDQVKNHKLMNEDLDTQLTVARVELNEAQQKLLTLGLELEGKQNYCEELEATCLELQLQHESVAKKEIPINEHKQEENQLRTDWEITAASEKLAECQETILNLGKQLKALASPKEAALFDKFVSASTDVRTSTTTTTSITTAPKPTLPKNKITSQRSSLLDQMIAEDNAKGEDFNSPKTIESDNNNYNSIFIPNGTAEPIEKIIVLNENNKLEEDPVPVGLSLAIVPSKKRGSGSLLKRLFSRKKKVSSSKKMSPPFAP